MIQWRICALFSLFLQSVTVAKSNPEYEAEKKAEKEDYEKKIGILTYLGQSATKDQGEIKIITYQFEPFSDYFQYVSKK